MKPLSTDLRQRILDAVDNREGSRRKLAERFAVNTSTITRLLQLRRQTGSCEPSSPPNLICELHLFRVSCSTYRSRRATMKRYKVTLEAEERQQLQDLIAAGKAAARKLAHARILLKADAAEDGPAWPDGRIAEALELSTATVERVRQRFVELGLDAALDRKQRERPPREIKLDGRAEARLIALACSPPPEGRAVWTMQLLADKLVELEVVASISVETVRLALKKTS